MKKSKILIAIVVIIAVVIMLLLILQKLDVIRISEKGVKLGNTVTGKIDDWVYDPYGYSTDSNGWSLGIGSTSGNSSGGGSINLDSFSSTDTSSASDSYLGYSTGGAKDISNFRENIENDYFPIMSDLTYEGIFYDYYFDTGNMGETSDEMFYPSYSTAVSNDPISGEEEYYLSVGLNSNIKESDFQRKKLNLVIVLDISGSMDSSFDSYYYDLDNEENDEENSKSKMRLAEESLNILIDQLNEDDSLGIVLFESYSHLAKPLNLVGDVDMDAIKNHILEINVTGGTNFESGYVDATKLFEEYELANSDEYENRIIVITDAMPNYGTTSDEGLLSYVEENADNGIYTTFIGVGVDFNAELVKQISSVRGGNYYSVSSAEQFKTRMGDEFEYMVTPLVFDLNLDLESDGYEIAAVYGTDDVDAEEGNIMHVNTLFPSISNSSEEVKGGLVLLKLRRLDNTESQDIKLKVTYEDVSGEEHSNEQTVTLNSEENYYDNTGIRKGIVLTRYVNVLKNWIAYERVGEPEFLIDTNTGIIEWDDVSTYYDLDDEYEDDYYYYYGYSNENERTSVDLSVSDEYKETFRILREYMSSEINEIGDDTLEQEIEILDKLIDE